MTETTDRTNVLAGELRVPRNAAANAKGGIHDDETAQRRGLRGGTVAGSVHLDLFPPLLLEVFGNRWFERGSLSINFRNPTVDREPVRAYVRRPPAGLSEDGVQVEAWIDREDGLRVGDGTVAVGQPSEPSALRALDLHRFPPGDLRILEGVTSGDAIPPVEVTIASA